MKEHSHKLVYSALAKGWVCSKKNCSFKSMINDEFLYNSFKDDQRRIDKFLLVMGLNKNSSDGQSEEPGRE